MTTKQLRVSLDTFAYEILADLPRLIEQNPTGVYFSALVDEYGESSARIMKACQVLVGKNLIHLEQAASKAHYIMPIDHKPTVPFIELTDLQRRLVLYLLDVAKQKDAKAIQTNYSQLARIIECSYGGLHTCINRLVALEYLAIEQQSAPGKQNQLILRLTENLLSKSALHLDS